jgi:hypothetical protein
MGAISDAVAKEFERQMRNNTVPVGYLPPATDRTTEVYNQQFGHTWNRIGQLEKLVHILWKEVERLQGRIKFTSEGIVLKDGAAEIAVLKNGGIVIHGTRISIETPGKSQLYM